MKVFNSISLKLLPQEVIADFIYRRSWRRDDVLGMTGLKSYIGHHDIAALVWLPVSRETGKLADGEHFLVVQYHGPRITTNRVWETLPEGAIVEIHEYSVDFREKRWN